MRNAFYLTDTRGTRLRFGTSGTLSFPLISGADNAISVESGRLAANADWFVDVTGCDVTGNGSAAAPWETLSRAFDAARSLTIAPGVTLRINLGPGEHELAGDVGDLPSGVVVCGATPLQRSAFLVTPMGGVVGLTVVAAASQLQDAEVAFADVSGGVNPDALSGVYAVQNAVMGKDGSYFEIVNRDPDNAPSGHITATAVFFQSKLILSDTRCERLALENLALIGHGTQPGLSLRNGDLAHVAARNFDGPALRCLPGGRLTADRLTISSADIGLECQAACVVQGDHVTLTHLHDVAATGVNNAALLIPGAFIGACPVGIVADWGAVVRFEQGRIINTPVAIMADHLAVVGIAGAEITGSITPPITPQPFALVSEENMI